MSRVEREPRSRSQLLPALGALERGFAKPSTDLHAIPVVFAGYGLTVPGVYDDYGSVDVTGKAVLIFSHEPQERDASSRLNGTRAMPQTTLSAKASLARKRGAKILLVVGDPSHRVDDAPYGLFEAILTPRPRHSCPESAARGHAAAARCLAARCDSTPDRRRPHAQIARSATGKSVCRAHREESSHVAQCDRCAAGQRSCARGGAIVIGAHYDHVGLWVADSP